MQFSGAKRWLLLGLALAILASYFTPHYNRYYLGAAIDIGIAIILATSLNLINGFTGQFSLGHAGFMAVGGYFSAWITKSIGSLEVASACFPLSLLGGGLLAAVVGFAVGVPSLRLRGDYLAIVTLGFGEIIRAIAQQTEAIGAASGMKGIPKFTTLGWVFGLAAVTVYTISALVNSTYGRGFIAVHDDEIAAESSGVNTTRTKVIAFVTGAFFAGIAGGLFAHHKQFLSPTGFDWQYSIVIVAMVILGGMGNTIGVIIGAVLVTILPEVLRFIPSFSFEMPVSHQLIEVVPSECRMIVYALLIILFMLLLPNGLFAFKFKRRSQA